MLLAQSDKCRGLGGRAPDRPGVRRNPMNQKPQETALEPIPTGCRGIGWHGQTGLTVGPSNGPVRQKDTDKRVCRCHPGSHSTLLRQAPSRSCFFPSLMVSSGSPCFGCGRRPLQARHDRRVAPATLRLLPRRRLRIENECRVRGVAGCFPPPVGYWDENIGGGSAVGGPM
jgi:hypothetical protein